MVKLLDILLLVYDITDKSKLELIIFTDSRTNIYNRRYFNDVFPKILNNAKRKNELVCFLFTGYWFFKQYNDNYGHQKVWWGVNKFCKMFEK